MAVGSGAAVGSGVAVGSAVAVGSGCATTLSSSPHMRRATNKCRYQDDESPHPLSHAAIHRPPPSRSRQSSVPKIVDVATARQGTRSRSLAEPRYGRSPNWLPNSSKHRS